MKCILLHASSIQATYFTRLSEVSHTSGFFFNQYLGFFFINMYNNHFVSQWNDLSIILRPFLDLKKKVV